MSSASAGSKKGASEGKGVKVVCRFRPQNQREIDEGGRECMRLDSEAAKVTLEDHEFNYDHVFGPETDQATMFTCAASLVDDVLAGYNGTIFAYGQTSSGKTHTMMGPDVSDEAMMGIIPRIVRQIFARIDEGSVNYEYQVTVSYFEIYLERVRDLLNPTQGKLAIRENKARGVFVQGLTERQANTADEVLQIMEDGGGNRKVSSTDMNAVSSRSHSLFQMTVRGKNLKDLSETTAKLNLVDLAGSEKIKKTNATGDRLDEAKNINTSLTALGKVIYALTDGKSKHIPYRDSKLTRVLSESLGGNSLTLLIINCSPSSFNATETLSTLRFGKRAKQIENKATVNAKRSPAEMELHINRLEKTIAKLRGYIAALEAELEARGGSEFVASLAASMDADAMPAPLAAPASAGAAAGDSGPGSDAKPGRPRTLSVASESGALVSAETAATLAELEAQVQTFEEENAALSLANNALMSDLERARDALNDDSSKVTEVKKKWKKAKLQMKAHSDKLVKQNTLLKRKVKALNANYKEVLAALDTFSSQVGSGEAAQLAEASKASLAATMATTTADDGPDSDPSSSGPDLLPDLDTTLDVSTDGPLPSADGSSASASSTPAASSPRSASHRDVMARVAEGLSTIQRQKLELSVVNDSIMESQKSLAEAEAKVQANLAVLTEREDSLSRSILAKEEELAALDDDRADLDELMRGLAADKAALVAEVSLLHTQKDDITGSTAELKLRLAALTSEFESKSAELEPLAARLTAVKSELADAEAALARQDAQKTAGREFLIDLKAKIEAGQGELSRLEKAAAAADARAQAAAQAAAAAEAELAELGPKAEQAAVAAAAADEAAAAAAAAQSELASTLDQAQTAKSELDAASSQLAQVNDELAAVQTALASTQAELADSTAAAAAARSEAAAAREDASAATSAAASAAADVAQAQSQLESLEAARDAAEAQVSKLSSTAAVAEERVTQAQARLDKLTAEVAAAESKSASMEGRMEELRSTTVELQDQARELQARVDALKASETDLTAAQAKVADINMQIARLTAQDESLSSTVADRQAKVDKLEMQLEAQRDEKVELATAMGLLQGEKSALAASLDTLRARIEAAEADSDRAAKAREQAQEAMHETEADLQVAKDTLADTLDKVSEADASVAALGQSKDELDATIAKLAREREDLCAELDALQESVTDANSAAAEESAAARSNEAALVATKVKLAEAVFARDEAQIQCSRLENMYLKLQKRYNDAILGSGDKQ